VTYSYGVIIFAYYTKMTIGREVDYPRPVVHSRKDKSKEKKAQASSQIGSSDPTTAFPTAMFR
jgi:hypothetical protein